MKEQAQAEGKLLPQRHPMVRAVEKVGMRIAHVAGDGHGGGYQEHMKVPLLSCSCTCLAVFIDPLPREHACMVLRLYALHASALLCCMLAQNLKWEFAVIDEPGTPNAFVVPGGKVVVFTGLLNLLQMHDDEIAAVLGHEVAHVLARHVVRPLGSGLPSAARMLQHACMRHQHSRACKDLLRHHAGREALLCCAYQYAADRCLFLVGYCHSFGGIPARAVLAKLQVSQLLAGEWR